MQAAAVIHKNTLKLNIINGKFIYRKPITLRITFSFNNLPYKLYYVFFQEIVIS
jgi:hypothetical protein